MELEEAIENLKIIKEFAGDNYTFGQQGIRNLKENLQVVLNHLTKQEKMIELMALAISSYDGQLVINQYKDRNEVKAKFEEYAVDGTYEQYFEKKAEESE